MGVTPGLTEESTMPRVTSSVSDESIVRVFYKVSTLKADDKPVLVGLNS